MARRDKIHDAIKNALINDGWRITHDPYPLKYGKDKALQVDLGAEKLFGAEKDERKIAVEVKSFLNSSLIVDFQKTVGQLEIYQALLEQLEPDRRLYLAVGNFVYQALFVSDIVKLVQRRNQISIIVVRLDSEEITAWIE